MCILCDKGNFQKHFTSRRNFLKGATAVGAAASALKLFAPRPAAAQYSDAPLNTGVPGRRYVIRGGSVMSMDPRVGDFPKADVLIEGKKILAVAPNLHAGNASEIDATGRIVMPGFIDTHHHQFETALRSFLADGVLINDGSGSPSGSTTYYEYILLTFAPVYRPQDVYINELFGGLSQLDDGVTTVHDVSQIHHSPAALGRCHQGAVRYRAARCLRLLRKRRRCPRQQVSNRRLPHQTAVVLVDRPTSPHDHGRRSLSWEREPPTSPGPSGDSSACRSPRIFSRRSAFAQFSTRSRRERAATATSGSDRTTCSSI